jgi:FtsH-binding integral membrane protein
VIALARTTGRAWIWQASAKQREEIMSEYQYAGEQGYGGAPVVAVATPAERAAFITKTYLHLFGAIAVFAVLEVFWFTTGVPALMFSALGASRFSWLIFMGAFVGVSMLANSWAMSSVSKPRQYLGLGLYTVAQSLLFIPLIALAIVKSGGPDGDAGILPKAILITLTLFGGLTGVVFITRKDFSFMRSVLMFASFAALGLIVASILFGFTLGLAFSYVMIAMACGYILYDTSNVMLHYRTSQHVAASLALFAAVMLLFWYVLRVLLNRRS